MYFQSPEIFAGILGIKKRKLKTFLNFSPKTNFCFMPMIPHATTCGPKFLLKKYPGQGKLLFDTENSYRVILIKLLWTFCFCVCCVFHPRGSFTLDVHVYLRFINVRGICWLQILYKLCKRKIKKQIFFMYIPCCKKKNAALVF